MVKRGGFWRVVWGCASGVGDCGARGLCRLVAVLMVGEWGLVTLRIVRGLFGYAVSIVRFLRTFVSFSVFRTLVPFVCLSTCPYNFLVFHCCFVVGIYRI